jgi:hypothetical protein
VPAPAAKEKAQSASAARVNGSSHVESKHEPESEPKQPKTLEPLVVA